MDQTRMGHAQGGAMSNTRQPIPQKWIRDYVDAFLRLAMELNPGSMRDAVTLRADHAMDLVESWRESDRQ